MSNQLINILIKIKNKINKLRWKSLIGWCGSKIHFFYQIILKPPITEHIQGATSYSVFKSHSIFHAIKDFSKKMMMTPCRRRSVE